MSKHDISNGSGVGLPLRNSPSSNLATPCMFSNVSNFVINGSTFVDNSNNSGRDAFQTLSQYVAQGATHNSRDQYDAPKCHPDTRKWLLSDIKEWMLEPNKETSILYLHGPAGAGKSCIARSACEQTHGEGFLLASFFFWRGSEYRNTTTRLVTTISYQLALQDSALAAHVVAEIQQDPRIIYDAPLEYQFRKLILEPCRRLADKSSGQLKGAIVIDGLDECIDKEAQISVLRLFATAVHRETFPLGVCITSRPELHLKEVWDTENISPVTLFISLSDVPNASDDIRTVLQSGFSRILNDRRFNVALQSVHRPWPSPDKIETLVERSSGQFIYAATVLKFISSRSRNPDAQLQIVLGLRGGSNASPFADLDSLYHEILSRTDDPERTRNVLAFILTIMDAKQKGNLRDEDVSEPILSAIYTDLSTLNIIVEQLISLPRGEALFALDGLHSLIELRRSAQITFAEYPPVSFYHRSFRDFLFTKNRSKEFYIDIEATHEEISRFSITFLSRSKYDTAEQHVGWLYSYFLWHIHIYESGRKDIIRNFEKPVLQFVGTPSQRYINCTHLQEAFRILGIQESMHPVYEMAKVLTGLQPPSVAALKQIRSHLWNWPGSHFARSTEFPSFKESLIYNPLLRAHLKSYKMDLFVKRALTIHAIIPLDELSESGLYSTGIIHELTSEFPGLRLDIDVLVPSSSFQYSLPRFLSSNRSSGIFSCTPEDIAEAYTNILNISKPVSSKCQEDQYSRLIEIWTSKLHYIEPAATPLFLAALISAARDSHDQPGINRSLTHKAEVELLRWLENLPIPQNTIEEWRKSFEKTRRATLDHTDGYDRYFCQYWQTGKSSCPTRSCPKLW